MGLWLLNEIGKWEPCLPHWLSFWLQVIAKELAHTVMHGQKMVKDVRALPPAPAPTPAPTPGRISFTIVRRKFVALAYKMYIVQCGRVIWPRNVLGSHPAWNLLLVFLVKSCHSVVKPFARVLVQIMSLSCHILKLSEILCQCHCTLNGPI
jgi:hypothetical protein